MIHRLIELLGNALVPSNLSLFRTIEGRTFGAGTTVGNGVEGWAPGAKFIHTDGATAITREYVNTGTSTTAVGPLTGGLPSCA